MIAKYLAYTSFVCRSALYANRAILESYKEVHPDRLSHSSSNIGNVFIHKTAEIDPSAVVRIFYTLLC